MSVIIGSNTKIKNSIIGNNKKEKELQVRINKAIEYIEHKANIKEYFMVNGKEYTELLDILKGSDTK